MINKYTTVRELVNKMWLIKMILGYVSKQMSGIQGLVTSKAKHFEGKITQIYLYRIYHNNFNNNIS